MEYPIGFQKEKVLKKINVQVISYEKRIDKMFVRIILKNDSKYSLEEVSFEVRFYNKSGKIIDVDKEWIHYIKGNTETVQCLSFYLYTKEEIERFEITVSDVVVEDPVPDIKKQIFYSNMQKPIKKEIKNNDEETFGYEKIKQTSAGEYVFGYVDEEKFRKLERSLKKYNMLAFKKLYFEYYPALKRGDFVGIKVDGNLKDGIVTFELKLPTNYMFAKVHGDIMLHYSVNTKEKIITLMTLTPEDILAEGHHTDLTTYKGVMISKKNQEKDMFKINLLNMIKK